MKRDGNRDAAIERMLAAGLTPAAGASTPCPEAGELAAFVEGGVSSAERETIEQHAATCDRCQHTLALIGSTAASAAPASSAARATRRVRWLQLAMPVAGLVLLAYLYIGLKSSMEEPGQFGVAQPVASVEKTPEPPAPEQRPLEDKAEGHRPAAPPAEAEVRRSQAAASKHKTRVDALASAPGKAAPAADEGKLAGRADADTSVRAGGAAGGGIMADRASSEGRQIANNQAQGPQNQTVQSKPDERNVQQQQAATQPRAEAFLAAPMAAPAAANSKIGPVGESVAVMEAPPNVIVAPNWSTRWRMEPGGGISRSLDRGDTWQRSSYRAPSTLLAGSAPATNICWLVGSAGTVVLTTDGEQWTPRPFPERVDLIGVGARDGLHATVTTRDGRRFATDDGGLTWSFVSRL